MAKDDPHFRLRIPPQLKGAIEEAAADEQRSINAEIVHRLYASFDYEEERGELLAKIASLEGLLEQESQRNVQSAASWDEWATRQFTDENTLYVVLDSDGHPICWDEITTHLAAISEASGGKVERIEAGIFDAPRESNDKRFEQWMKLREFYRSKRKAKR